MPPPRRRHTRLRERGRDPAAVGRAAAALLAAFRAADDPRTRDAIGWALASVGPHLNPDAAADVLTALLGWKGLRPLDFAEPLMAIAGRVPPGRAGDTYERVASALVAALRRPLDLGDRRALTGRLGAVAADLPPDRAATVCAPVAAALLAALEREKEPTARAALADALAAVVPYLEPAGPTADKLLTVLSREDDADTLEALAACLAAVAPRLGPARAADALLAAAEKADGNFNFGAWARALAAVARPLGAERAAGVYARAADRLLAGIRAEANSGARAQLAYTLAALSAWVEPARAAAVCGPAADLVLADVPKNPHPFYRSESVGGLAALAARLEPARAAELAARAAELALDGLQGGVSFERGQLADSLSGLAVYLSPGRAADVIAALIEGGSTQYAEVKLAERLAAVATRLPADHAARVRARAARALLDEMQNTTGPLVRGPLTDALSVAVGGGVTADRPLAPRAAAFAAGTAPAPQLLIAGLPLLRSQAHPQPLPPQDLVELLKHPFCVGVARRAVLDALELTYQRPFKDQWEFVEYAQKHQPHLDLLTPPKRPEPKS